VCRVLLLLLLVPLLVVVLVLLVGAVAALLLLLVLAVPLSVLSTGMNTASTADATCASCLHTSSAQATHTHQLIGEAVDACIGAAVFCVTREELAVCLCIHICRCMLDPCR
jgi:hypothetical protein